MHEDIPHPTLTTFSAESFLGFPTAVPTGHASISPASSGTSISPSSPASRSPTASQSRYLSRGKITGIRLWIPAISSFGSVVITVHDTTHPSVPEFVFGTAGSRQTSHNPANANGFPVFIRIYIGCFFFPSGSTFHS